MLALSCTLAHICIRVSIIASRTYVFLEAFLSTKLSQREMIVSAGRARYHTHPWYLTLYSMKPTPLYYARLVCADPLPVFV